MKLYWINECFRIKVRHKYQIVLEEEPDIRNMTGLRYIMMSYCVRMIMKPRARAWVNLWRNMAAEGT